MRRSLLIAASFLILPLLVRAAEPNDDTKFDKLKASVKAFFDAVGKEDFETAGKDFDDAVKKALPTEKVKEMWQGLNKSVGALKKQRAPRTETKGKYDIVIV